MKYKETKVFVFPKAVVRVHIPDISAEERSKRMARIHKAAERLLRG